jgi:hypothetical protein
MNDLNSNISSRFVPTEEVRVSFLGILDKMLHEKNGSLAAGFSVRMPYNYVIPSLKLKNFSDPSSSKK